MGLTPRPGPCRPRLAATCGSARGASRRASQSRASGRQVPVRGVNPIEALTTNRNFPPAPPPGVLFSTANGAIRRAAVLARPFDEEIAIAEDHLWARGVAERIVYVPEAGGAHRPPLPPAGLRGAFSPHALR